MDEAARDAIVFVLAVARLTGDARGDHVAVDARGVSALPVAVERPCSLAVFPSVPATYALVYPESVVRDDDNLGPDEAALGVGAPTAGALGDGGAAFSALRGHAAQPTRRIGGRQP